MHGTVTSLTFLKEHGALKYLAEHREPSEKLKFLKGHGVEGNSF